MNLVFALWALLASLLKLVTIEMLLSITLSLQPAGVFQTLIIWSNRILRSKGHTTLGFKNKGIKKCEPEAKTQFKICSAVLSVPSRAVTEGASGGGPPPPALWDQPYSNPLFLCARYNWSSPEQWYDRGSNCNNKNM